MRAPPTYDEVKAAYSRQGYRFADHGRYNVNIFGDRNPNTIPNKFDDHVGVAFIGANGEPTCKWWPATTDPGLYWLEHPMYPRGTGIMKPGQYLDCYKIARSPHLGYDVMFQTGPITILLDDDQNDRLNFKSTKEERGIFYAHIHHAADGHASLQVDKWSALCQVFADPDDFADFMRIIRASKEIYGNLFSYTLFTEDQL